MPKLKLMTEFRIAFLVPMLAMVAAICAQPGFSQRSSNARVFILSIKDYQNLKPSDAAYLKADNDAKKALTASIEPITSKQSTPPSKDKHDYMSQAPYFWPDPKSPTGLPYIRRDGERNPEIKQFPDHDLLDKMADAVERLSIGFYVTGKKEYAEKAGEILRMWFLDPGTRMNPNLEYAQAIPGVNTGRGIGLIETRGLTRVVDSIGLLSGSSSWTRSDQAGVEAWFSKFLAWMRESKNGKDESSSKNNHGTFYDVQVASYALFVGDRELAKTTLENAKQKRISAQIENDGRQPLELERTKSWDYSVMNLEGLLELAELAEHVDVDLWNFQSAGGGSIRKAIAYLQPFAANPAKWPYKQIVPINTSRFNQIVHSALNNFKSG